MAWWLKRKQKQTDSIALDEKKIVLTNLTWWHPVLWQLWSVTNSTCLFQAWWEGVTTERTANHEDPLCWQLWSHTTRPETNCKPVDKTGPEKRQSVDHVHTKPNDPVHLWVKKTFQYLECHQLEIRVIRNFRCWLELRSRFPGLFHYRNKPCSNNVAFPREVRFLRIQFGSS